MIRTLVAIVLVANGLLAGGCAEKAQALKAGVTQFEAESIAAIDAIDSMRRQEMAPARQFEADATDEFVSNVLQLDGSTDIDEKTVNTLLDPFAVTPSPQLEQRWSRFTQSLRAQYMGFARIFDEIDRASFTARDKVREAQPFIEKLTAQLTYFARTIEDAPPRLLQHRSALLAEINGLASASARGTAEITEKRKRIAQWREKWRTMIASEAELKRTTVEQCIKAAMIGAAVRKQIAEYDQISVADINGALKQVFAAAHSVTGNDYADLRARAAKILATVQNDPVWNTVAETALAEINQGLASRHSGSTGQ